VEISAQMSIVILLKTHEQANLGSGSEKNLGAENVDSLSQSLQILQDS